MLKKILCMTLVSLLLLASFTACGKDAEEPVATDDTAVTTDEPQQTPLDETPEQPEDGKTEEEGEQKEEETELENGTVLLNASTKGIKLIGGRRIASDSYIACDYYRSGIEFVLHNAGLAVTIHAKTSAPIRFEVYVDGTLKQSINGANFFEVNGEGMISLAGVSGGMHTIRVVRITGQEAGTAELTAVTYSGVLSTTAPANEDLYVEFVGNSAISSYATSVVAELDADYSILSASDYAIGGQTDMSTVYGLASPERSETTAHDFARKADIVVLDLRSVANTVNADAFTEAYETLLETVRTKNGSDVKIICIYNNTDGEYATAIAAACKALGGQENAGIYTCRMESGSDGQMSADEYSAFAQTLTTVIGHALDGLITELDTETNGDGLNVSYNDFTVL
ncbi:MAG: hypothetical protein E7668_02405 [Ruminococcaceae bacterium]|nr:hypothetical protein [Oscillospiraceae bacterium]